MAEQKALEIILSVGAGVILVEVWNILRKSKINASAISLVVGLLAIVYGVWRLWN